MSNTRFASIAAIGLVLATAAHSATFSGTFSGIAYGSRIEALGPNPSDFDGLTVTGTFWLDTSSLPPPDSQDAESSFTVFPPALLKLTFSVPGQETVVFDGSEGNNALYLANDSNGKAVTLSPDFSFPYWNATLQLAGSFFDGVDPKTLRPAAMDLSASGASFFAGRDFGGALDLTSVQFNTVSAIPEPESTAMLLAGLALLACVRRRGGFHAR